MFPMTPSAQLSANPAANLPASFLTRLPYRPRKDELPRVALSWAQRCHSRNAALLPPMAPERHQANSSQIKLQKLFAMTMNLELQPFLTFSRSFSHPLRYRCINSRGFSFVLAVSRYFSHANMQTQFHNVTTFIPIEPRSFVHFAFRIRIRWLAGRVPDALWTGCGRVRPSRRLGEMRRWTTGRVHRLKHTLPRCFITVR